MIAWPRKVASAGPRTVPEGDVWRDSAGERIPHLRDRNEPEQKTTMLELFFDLIYVFAVTQLSHLVIDGDVRLLAVGRAAFLLLVVWWAWIYTTWMVNWFDPESTPVGLLLLVVAALSLLFAVAVPHAFGATAVLFAVSYVVLQGGRNLAAMLLLPSSHQLRRVFERILAWSSASAVLWLAGGFLHHNRAALWGAALTIDILAPLIGYRTPGLGQSQTSDWPVDGGHFAERFQSFIIIALGESIVVTGVTASALQLSATVIAMLVLAFVITAELWWLYFGDVAERARQDLASAEDPGRLARDAYTYLHLPIVAGIIMVAVADDRLVSRPGAVLGGGAAIMAALGPAIYLAGESAVRLRMAGWVSADRALSTFTLAILAVLGRYLSAAAVGGLVAAILLLLGIVESPPIHARRGPPLRWGPGARSQPR